MPPANSPVNAAPTLPESHAPARTPSPSSYIPTLRNLGSPVLDLASTLSYQPEDDVDADNVSFLRTPIDDSDEESYGTRRERNSDDNTRNEQILHRQAQALESWGARQANDRTQSPYGNRVPVEQSLYDWAPANESGDEEELDEIIAELRQQQPNAPGDVLRLLGRAQMDAERELRNRGVGSRGQSAAPNQPSHEPSLRSAAILQSVRRNHRFSARSRDLMQRYVLERERANRIASAAGERPYMLRYVPNRTQATGGGENDARDSQNLHRLARPAENASPRPNEGSRYMLNRMAWQASQLPGDNSPATGRDHLDSLRRRYLETSNPKPSEFERIIKYLYSIRSQDSDLESADSKSQTCIPEDAPLHTRVNGKSVSQAHRHCPPPPTSWLAPGTKFSGFQQATPLVSSGATLYRLASNRSSTSNAFDPSSVRPAYLDVPRLWFNQNPSATPPRMSASPTPAAPSNPNQDRWTVRVAIHAVDYEKMTLQGTMEAFNVPPHSSSTHATGNNDASAGSNATTSSHGVHKNTFSTYLEGELIDFKNHTLLTESDFKVKTTPEIDAAYWRKLEPFAKLSDEDIARALLDRQWIEEELMGRYVLMRWKERCFVQPTFTASSAAQNQGQSSTQRSSDGTPIGGPPPPTIPDTTASFLPSTDGAGYGLSISGFYYVSLRRSDGRCEGLYFDPQSTPYQHLELKPTQGKWGMGSWEFR